MAHAQVVGGPEERDENGEHCRYSPCHYRRRSRAAKNVRSRSNRLQRGLPSTRSPQEWQLAQALQRQAASTWAVNAGGGDDGVDVLGIASAILATIAGKLFTQARAKHAKAAVEFYIGPKGNKLSYGHYMVTRGPLF